MDELGCFMKKTGFDRKVRQWVARYLMEPLSATRTDRQNPKGHIMTNHFTRPTRRFRSLSIGALLALPLATFVMAGPDVQGGRGGGFGIPLRGGIVVGNPADTFTGSDDQRGGRGRSASGASTLGDVNRDGVVDAHDLGAFLDLLGTDDARGDIDGDGQVDGEDFARFVQAWK
jgi:hypothetical protein